MGKREYITELRNLFELAKKHESLDVALDILSQIAYAENLLPCRGRGLLSWLFKWS